MLVGLDAVTAEFDHDVVSVVVAVGFEDGVDVLRRFLRRDLVRLELVGQGDREDPVCNDGRKGKRFV